MTDHEDLLRILFGREPVIDDAATADEILLAGFHRLPPPTGDLRARLTEAIGYAEAGVLDPIIEQAARAGRLHETIADDWDKIDPVVRHDARMMAVKVLRAALTPVPEEVE